MHTKYILYPDKNDSCYHSSFSYQILTKEGFFSFLAKLKQAFIKILNTDQDGICSGPPPQSFPAVASNMLPGLTWAKPIGYCNFP